MTLNDWHKILDDLSDSVDKYVENPFRQPTDSVRQIANTNFELRIQWEDMDASFYSKLLSSIDFDLVFPFVIKVKVGLQSNVDEFVPVSTVKTPVRKKTAERKKTADKSPQRLSVPLTNGDSSNHSIKLKECCVRLPIMQFDENGELIQSHNENKGNKRKHSSLVSDEMQSMKLTPKIRNGPNELFMCSSSSTPFVRNFGVALKQIENEVRGTFGNSEKAGQKVVKRLTNRLTTTPRTSNDRKSGLQFNPRIRLLKMPENVNRPSKKLKQKNIAKKQIKVKAKSRTTKRLKVKARSVANETELFEVPADKPTNKVKKPTTKAHKQKSSAVKNTVKVEDR